MLDIKKGDRYGEWTVIRRSYERRNGLITYLCECSCGVRSLVRSEPLKHGKSKSCGHTNGDRFKPKLKDLQGTRVGLLTVEHPTDKRTPKGYIVWRCRCDCGAVRDVGRNLLRANVTRACGSAECRRKLRMMRDAAAC